jgi:hypothetical protein
MGILHHSENKSEYNKKQEKNDNQSNGVSRNKLFISLIIFLGIITLFLIQSKLSSSLSSNDSSNYMELDKLIEDCRKGKYGIERDRNILNLIGVLPKPSSGLSNIIQPGELLYGIIPPKQNYSIRTNSSLNKITLQFWDYADVDGDYIQIFQNGSAIAEPFKITHTIKNIVIENNGVIQVKGIKDGQNGISYGIKFESGSACINIIAEGEINTYTIIH